MVGVSVCVPRGVAGAAGDAEGEGGWCGRRHGGVSGIEAALSTALNARVRGGVAIFAHSLWDTRLVTCSLRGAGSL